MTDPTPFMPTGPAGTTNPGAYVVPLARARFILKAQFFHPIKESDQPLPLHQFYMFCVKPKGGAPAVMGEPSQADGVSWLNYTLDATEDVPGTFWALAWRPLRPRPDGSVVPTDDVGVGEAWLDLDKMEWVDFKDIGFIEKRKLLRLPLWASFLKAQQGGFVESPKGTSFGSTGMLSYDDNDLKPYGDPKKPWKIQVDHGLFRSYVRFAYYDLKEKARKPVPPGLVVHAQGERFLSGPAAGTQSRVAAGTAIDDDGTVYMVHERTKAHLAKAKFEYFFFTGKLGTDDHGIIDFSKTAPRDKITVVSKDPSDKRDERYLLPREWQSFGMQSWTKVDGNDFPQRQDFKKMRTEDTTKSKPLFFHLDDAVIAAGPFDPVDVKKDARMTLFDHLMTMRLPDDKKPHFWKTVLPRNYLSAEDAVYLKGEGIEKVTRVVFHEGILYELREARVQAIDKSAFGKTQCIGARAAITGQFDDKLQMVSYLSGNPSMPDYLGQVKGRSVQHLLDVSADVKHQVGGVDVKLLHLISWVPCFFENKLGAAGKATFDAAIPFLNAAAERWDQTHPGHPGQPAANRVPAEYVLAPVDDDGAIKANMRVVRVRHFFCEVPSTVNAAGTASSTYGDAVKIVITQSSDPNARAGANSLTHTVTCYKGDIGPIFGPADDAEPGQDTSSNRFTLAHEMGHILGFPDEYIEGNLGGTPPTTLGWKYASWGQYMIDSAAARPFGTDGPAMMNNNNKPRLRHFWHYANRITTEAGFVKMVDPKPYFPINLAKATGGKLVLERPFSALSTDTQSAYHPASSGFFPDASHRCDAVFYRLATDEGTVERMYKKTAGEINTATAADKIYDGVVLIRIKFMVQLDPTDNNAMGQAVIFDTLQQICVNGNLFTKQFAIELDPAQPKAGRSHAKPNLRRIFVGFQPQFDYTNRYTGAAPPVPVPGGAHISINVVKTRATPNPLLTATPPSPLPLLVTELDESLLRYALGRPTFKEDAATHVKTLLTTLDPADLQPVADRLHTMLTDDPAPLRKARST